MAPSTASPRAAALAAAAGAGALTGLFLTAGELLASQVVGRLLSPPAWLFLLAYATAAGALAAAAHSAVRHPPRAAAAVTAVRWMVPALLFLYAAAVANQNLLRAPSRVLSARALTLVPCAAAAAAAAWALRRFVPARGRWPRLAPLLALVAAVVLLQRASDPPPWLPRFTAALVLPALALLGATALAVAVAAAARGNARWAAVLEAGVPLAIGCAASLGSWHERALYRHDRPQPPPRARAFAERRPNVILIVLDTVRAENLSVYGYPRPTSPRLSALAREGVLYSNALAPGVWSLPGHASLFTGLFPSEHGVGLTSPDSRKSAPLGLARVTLAEALAAQGYATAGISANPLVSGPFNLDQGFNYFDARFAYRGLNSYQSLVRRVQNWLPRFLLAAPFEAYFRPVYRTGDQITDDAVRWLRSRRPPGQPFLLFLNYMDAHPPLLRRAGFDAGWGPELPRDESQRRRALYDGGIAFADAQVGRLLDALGAQGDADRNWVIVTADHGEMLGEHGQQGHHCSLYYSLLHVPLIMRYPRGAGPPAGTVDEGPISLVDVAPRVLQALGLSLPGTRPAPRRSLLAMSACQCGPAHAALHGDASEAVVLDGLEYVEETGRPPRLYDLRRDPGEEEDASARLPEQQARLRAELQEWRAALFAVPPPPSEDEAGRREREEALRALGYLH